MKLYPNPKKKEQLPTAFNHGQQQLTDHREIANQFNIFFANIGRIQSSSISYTGEKNLIHILQNQTKFHLSINM